jgi:aldehyde dehydrogenase (NAD+)
MWSDLSSELPSGALLLGEDRITGASGGLHHHVYPGTGRVNAIVEMAGSVEVGRAVEQAARAQRRWMSYPPDRRRDILFDLADLIGEHHAEFARINTHDYGVPTSLAATSVLTERFFRFYAGYVDKAEGASTPVTGGFDLNLVEHEPYGVVGVIAPWNGALVVVGLAVAPALAAGNAVILKPSELAPLAALRFGELCLEAGLPAGLVNVLPAGPAGGQALVRHPGVGKVHFTGGTATARKVLSAAAENITPVVAELGGTAAGIIFDDADLDAAVRLAAHQGPIMQAGQSCACCSRILVQDNVYDAFMEKFLAAVTCAPVGDPLCSDVLFGPVINQAAVDRILTTIDVAVTEGFGDLVLGGNRIGGELASGFYVEPTVFMDVDNRSPLAQEEIFGPVVSVIRFSDDAQAVDLANDTRYGLNAFVHTTNLQRAHTVSRQLQAGSVWVNSRSDIQPQGPYGGYKHSGIGRSGGIEGLREFLQTKNIRIKLS